MGACMAYVVGGILLRMPIYVSYVIGRTQLAARPLLLIVARHAFGLLLLLGLLTGMRRLLPSMPELAATFVFALGTLLVACGLFWVLHRRRVFPDGWRLVR